MIKAALIILSILSTPIFSFAKHTDIFVVRHAEKLKGEDPGLTQQGQKRAQALKFLQEAFAVDISGIYTSSARRTNETATPLSNFVQKPIVNVIGKTDFDTLFEDIREKHEEKAVLVVGHTSTIPKLIKYVNPTIEKFRISSRNFSRLFRIKLVDGEFAGLEEFRYEPSDDNGIDLEQVL